MKDKILIYTDGACHPNPGHAGAGILLLFNEHRKEISQYLGDNITNQVAELLAIKIALHQIKEKFRNLEIIIHTDSRYCIGLLTLHWKPKKNKEIVNNIKKLINNFDLVRFIKVKGHSNDELNNRADYLAVLAKKDRKNRVFN